MLFKNDESFNESQLNISESDSASICFLSAVSFTSVILVADTESSSVMSVTCQLLKTTFSKVSCSDFSFIKQRKCDRKMKKFTNNLNSDSDYIFWKQKHWCHFSLESSVSVSLIADYELESFIQQWWNELLKFLKQFQLICILNISNMFKSWWQYEFINAAFAAVTLIFNAD